MIALDTNVLVRYLVQDEIKQAEKATYAIESLTVENPGFISCIVLCEINWVLATAYDIPKSERVNILDRVLSIGVFAIENLDLCLKALAKFEAGSADFSDHLIWQIAKQEGCAHVLTFDKAALKSDGFKSP
jgi:predicted nucleic-acid-binding protein